MAAASSLLSLVAGLGVALGGLACDRGAGDPQPPKEGAGPADDAEPEARAGVTCEGAACTAEGVKAVQVQDYALATKLFQRACDGGDAPGCLRLGDLLETGQGHERDPTRAAELFARACEGGEAEACVRRGQLALAGEGPDASPATGVGFFEKACAGGKPLACTTAAEIIYAGRGVERDQGKAIDLYFKACDAGERIGCLNAGELLIDPNKGKDVNERAVLAFTKACDAGSGAGCVKAGVAHYKGVGAPKDVAKAIAAFKRGCAAELKSEDGCHAATQLEQAKGKPVQLELTTAVDKLDYDGLATRDLACRMRQEGVMALGEILSGVSKQKSKLDACAPDGVALAVTWTFARGRVTAATVDAGGDDKIAACVTKALKKARIKDAGRCTAKLLIGDPAAAAGAFAKLNGE